MVSKYYSGMSAQILSGIKPAKQLLESLKPAIAKLNPQLVIIQVGTNKASSVYILQKIKACKRVNMRYQHIILPETTTFTELHALILELNEDSDVHGFILQLPLPEHLQAMLPLLIKAMNPKKDVDGFGAYNLGKMFLSVEFEHLPPATPAGVIHLLEYYHYPIAGQNIVVIGHSNIVGKPLGTMLLNRNATVTNCHVHTKDLRLFTEHADIVCTAAGVPNVLTADMVQSNAVIIDIGFNRTASGHLVGDCDFAALVQKVTAITPVPGGIGPMTVACLLRNTVTAAARQLAS